MERERERESEREREREREREILREILTLVPFEVISSGCNTLVLPF